MALTRPSAFTVLPASVLDEYADEIERAVEATFGNLTNTLAPAVSVKRTSAQTITTGTNTHVIWQTATSDPDGMWDPGAPTVLSIITPGAWLFASQVHWSGAAPTGGVRGTKILSGPSSATDRLSTSPSATGGGEGPTIQLLAAERFSAAGTIYLEVFHSAGSNTTIDHTLGGTYMFGFWLGP